VTFIECSTRYDHQFVPTMTAVQVWITGDLVKYRDGLENL